MVMGGDSGSKGCGFEYLHRILDLQLICCKICNDVSFKIPKINDKKRPGWPIFHN